MLVDVVPVAALVVLLAAAYAHPRASVELGLAVVAAAATWACGALPDRVASEELRHLGPVVGFLVAILVVAESCRVNGIFVALGARLARLPHRGRLLVVTFAVATAVTVVLSLDATVVLLTPVVLAATRTRYLAAELSTVRLANSASLLIPVANLTNLLALPALGLTFGRFALLMAPSWLVILAVEYLAVRVLARGETRVPLERRDVDARLARFPLVVVALMLVGFAVGSPYGVEPVWIAAVAAVVLVVHDLSRGRTTPRRVAESANVPFALFVLGLGLVVAALGAGWFGDGLAHLVPSGTGLLALLALAGLGAVLANVVNNLPATLLLIPVAAPLGTVALLALLIGINVGSSLTWTGSLANLLWRRTLLAAGQRPPTKAFHLTAAVASPVGIVAGVAVLSVWTHLVG